MRIPKNLSKFLYKNQLKFVSNIYNFHLKYLPLEKLIESYNSLKEIRFNLHFKYNFLYRRRMHSFSNLFPTIDKLIKSIYLLLSLYFAKSHLVIS